MSEGILELYRDGEPTGKLFFTEENAMEYVHKHDDGAAYETRPFSPW